MSGGTTFTVTGPKGSMTVTATPGGDPAVLSSTGAFLVPGDYTIAGGLTVGLAQALIDAVQMGGFPIN